MTDEQEGPYTHLKPLRKLLIVLLVIFSVLSIAYNMITLNFLRLPLEEHFGGKMRILGDIKMGLDGFYPTLVAHDVTFGDIRLKSAEMRVPLGIASPGNAVKTHVYLTELTLPGRPPIDIDLPGETDTRDGSLDNFTARAGKSEISGNISYKSGALDAKAEVQSLDYGLLYPGGSGGEGQGTLVLTGAGANIDTLVSSANGHLKLEGGKGKIPGRALALWGGNVLAALLPSDAAVNCAVAEFVLKNGVATATRIAVDTEGLNITGTGTIDFNTQYMDMTFTPQPKAASTVNTAVPLQVSGVFGEVTTTPVGSPVAPNPSAPSPCQQVTP